MLSGKAEYLVKGEKPRFVVTSLRVEQMAARNLYEDFYCARGEMEERIKEQQLVLFADRTSMVDPKTHFKPTDCRTSSLLVRNSG